MSQAKKERARLVRTGFAGTLARLRHETSAFQLSAESSLCPVIIEEGQDLTAQKVKG